MKIKKLLEEHSALVAQRKAFAQEARTIHDKRDAGTLTPEEETRWSELCDKTERLELDIAAKQKECENEARMLKAEQDAVIDVGELTAADVRDSEPETPDEKKNAELRYKIMEDYIRGKITMPEIRRHENPAVRSMFASDGGQTGLEIGVRDMIRQIAHRRREQRATLVKSTDVVGPNIFAGMIRLRQHFDGVRQAGANVITTPHGNPMTFNRYPVPTKAVIVGEGATATTNNAPSKTVITLGAFMYRSGWYTVSFEMLDDAAYDVMGMFADFAEESIGRGIAEHFTTGAGTTEPQGIMTGATVGKTAASPTVLLWGECQDLFRSVDPAYRAMGGTWMANDATFGEMKKMKDDVGRPIWTNAFGSTPELIDGYPHQINNEVATIAASAKVLAFGDYRSAYAIRDVSGMRVLRTDDKFADDGEVGLQAYGRHDGAVINAAAVKTLQMSA